MLTVSRFPCSVTILQTLNKEKRDTVCYTCLRALHLESRSKKMVSLKPAWVSSQCGYSCILGSILTFRMSTKQLQFYSYFSIKECYLVNRTIIFVLAVSETTEDENQQTKNKQLPSPHLINSCNAQKWIFMPIYNSQTVPGKVSSYRKYHQDTFNSMLAI